MAKKEQEIAETVKAVAEAAVKKVASKVAGALKGDDEKIDAKIPEGPLAEKWTNYKAHQKLVQG